MNAFDLPLSRLRRAGRPCARVLAFPIPTLPAVDELLFSAWVAEAAPGDVIEYHRGFLGLDRTGHGPPMSIEDRSALSRMSHRALCLAEDGLIHLVQRRLGPDTFSYLAVARSRRRNAPVSLATIVPAEAA
ncbi:MAG: hypothetical protein KDK07_20625 [Bauldia sp.]|nr:hypothetical protein [Bauldia sp.]